MLHQTPCFSAECVAQSANPGRITSSADQSVSVIPAARPTNDLPSEIPRRSRPWLANLSTSDSCDNRKSRKRTPLHLQNTGIPKTSQERERCCKAVAFYPVPRRFQLASPPFMIPVSIAPRLKISENARKYFGKLLRTHDAESFRSNRLFQLRQQQLVDCRIQIGLVFHYAA